MIKKIKQQSRQILFKNYKLFLPPVTLYMFSNLIINSIVYSLFYGDYLGQLNWFMQSTLFVLFLVFKLAVLPVSVYIFYSVSARLINDENNVHNVSSNLIVKIILIGLIPNLLSTTSLILSSFYRNTELSEIAFLTFNMGNTIILATTIYMEYKLFACNYYFTTNDSTIKNTLKFSFGIMNKKYWKYALLVLSFTFWYISGIILTNVLVELFSLNSFYQTILQPLGGGIYLFLVPYQYLSYSIFIKEIME